MQLYVLAEKFAALMARQEESEFAEIPTEELDGAFNDLEDKLENCAGYFRNKSAEAEAFKAESDRLAQKGKACQNQADGIRAYMKASMELAGVPKVKVGVFGIALQNNPPTVDCNLPIEKVPAKYVRVIPEQRELDKAIILAEWREAKEKNALDKLKLPKGIAITQGQHLRIR